MPPWRAAGGDAMQHIREQQLMGAMDALIELFPGAALCLFVFDGNAMGSQANYITNAGADGLLSALEEWANRQKRDAG